ncbi:mucin-5AC-like isoform X9 [Anopheles darlingi]|uniref:mucin-5AC-like isoform X9 n=1 Tax=Anopheles darlingi TaxID=43151 RepID=UPI0020FFFA5F|nr:mucin-5AC-like isoform X9 [Anopheles darlingi]
MGKLTSAALLLALLVCVGVTKVAAQKQRVCLARIADYGTATAFGFCNQAVYLALRLNTNAAITYVNTAMTSAAVEAGIRTYAGYKTTYPQVDFYLGVDSLPGSYETWITNARATAISAITAQLRTYPTVAGVYIDIVNVPANRGSFYRSFITELQTAVNGAGFKFAIALPWDSTTYNQIYLPTSPTPVPIPDFYLVKTYEDMYSDQTTKTHPISPLFAMAAPFNVETKTIYNNVFRWVLSGIPTLKLALGLPMYGLRFTAASATALGATSTVVNPDTYCNALIFGVTNTAGAAQAGEGFAYSSSAMMVYNTFDSVIDKLNFASATNLFGVGLYSMDQAGSTNAELLRYVTSVLAPVPPAGVVYPAAEPATCQVPITFPVPPTTTTTPTTTTPTTTTPTTTTPTTTTPTTTTPTTTTPTTTTPTTTTPTTTTPTTTTPTTTTPTTTTPTTTTPTTTTPTTTTPTTTTPTTTTPTTTTPTTTTPTTTTPTTTTPTTTTPTTTTPTTTTPTTTTPTTTTPTTTTPTTTTPTTTTPTTTTPTTTTPTTTTPTTTTPTTTTPTTTTPTTTTPTTTTPTTTTPTTTTPTTTTPTTTTPTTTTPTTTTPTTTTPTTTTPTTTTPTTTTPTTTTPTTTTTTAVATTTAIPGSGPNGTGLNVSIPQPLVCGAPARAEYGNLVSQYCSGIQNVTAFVVLGGTCGTAS